MAQKIRCPQCGNFCQAELAAMPQVVACPYCGQRLRVPAAQAAAPAPAATPRRRAEPTPPADDGIPEVAPVRSDERPFEYDARQRAARRHDDDDYEERRPRRGEGRGYRPAGSLAEVRLGLGFFWWKNLLLIVCVAASLLPVALAELARTGPVFAILLLLVAVLGGLCAVAALVFGAIGGFGCARLPEELREARTVAVSLRALEIVVPVLSLLSGLLVLLLATVRRPGVRASEYELLGFGFLFLAILGFICFLISYVLLLLFLRQLARHYDDEPTAARALWVLIAFVVAGILGPATLSVVAGVLRGLRVGMVPAFITMGGIGIVIAVVWVWILVKIMQTITTVQDHLGAAMPRSSDAPARMRAFRE